MLSREIGRTPESDDVTVSPIYIDMYIYIYIYIYIYTHILTILRMIQLIVTNKYYCFDCGYDYYYQYLTGHSCRELVVAFGRPGVRLPAKPTSGLQYSCSDQEFRLFVLTTAAPINREERKTYRRSTASPATSTRARTRRIPRGSCS